MAAAAADAAAAAAAAGAGAWSATPSPGQLDELRATLRKSGMDAGGVLAQILSELHSLAAARDSYKAILDPGSLASPHADLSTEESVATCVSRAARARRARLVALEILGNPRLGRLSPPPPPPLFFLRYCAFFGADGWLRDESMKLALHAGRRRGLGAASARLGGGAPGAAPPGAAAARGGLRDGGLAAFYEASLRAAGGAADARAAAGGRPAPPAAFDDEFLQCGPDLYARKDNQFMLFNSIGVASLQ